MNKSYRHKTNKYDKITQFRHNIDNKNASSHLNVEISSEKWTS